jgi:hypothetical protein
MTKLSKVYFGLSRASPASTRPRASGGGVDPDGGTALRCRGPPGGSAGVERFGRLRHGREVGAQLGVHRDRDGGVLADAGAEALAQVPADARLHDVLGGVVGHLDDGGSREQPEESCLMQEGAVAGGQFERLQDVSPDCGVRLTRVGHGGNPCW